MCVERIPTVFFFFFFIKMVLLHHIVDRTMEGIRTKRSIFIIFGPNPFSFLRLHISPMRLNSTYSVSRSILDSKEIFYGYINVYIKVYVLVVSGYSHRISRKKKKFYIPVLLTTLVNNIISYKLNLGN